MKELQIKITATIPLNGDAFAASKKASEVENKLDELQQFVLGNGGTLNRTAKFTSPRKTTDAA